MFVSTCLMIKAKWSSSATTKLCSWVCTHFYLPSSAFRRQRCRENFSKVPLKITVSNFQVVDDWTRVQEVVSLNSSSGILQFFFVFCHTFCIHLLWTLIVSWHTKQALKYDYSKIWHLPSGNIIIVTASQYIICFLQPVKSTGVRKTHWKVN